MSTDTRIALIDANTRIQSEHLTCAEFFLRATYITPVNKVRRRTMSLRWSKVTYSAHRNEASVDSPVERKVLGIVQVHILGYIRQSDPMTQSPRLESPNTICRAKLCSEVSVHNQTQSKMQPSPLGNLVNRIM